MHTMDNISAIFGNRTELSFLLQLHLLTKAVYELGYKLNGQSGGIRISLRVSGQVLFEIEKFNS
jgi:predicted trehalose synthase